MDRRTFLSGAVASIIAAPAIAQNTRAQTLRFVPQANLTSFDPIWTTATVTNNHAYYVFDTLFGFDMDLKAQPQMAESYEKLDDGRTWRFKLREGLTFHDGQAVRSQDCIASVKRWCQRDTFGQLLAKANPEWKAIDDRTFEVKLPKPFPLMISALAKADNAPFIMPERLAVTDGNKQITEMVGSGPYKFVASEYNSGSRVVYEKFAGYKPRSEAPSRNAGGKVGNFNRIEWHVLPDPATAANALIQGEIDWWERPLVDLMPMLAKSSDVKLEVTDPTGRMGVMRLNHLQEPFNNMAIRQAVRLATIQEEHMRASRGDDTSTWQTCRNLWPRGTPYYTGELEDLMPQSLDKAKAQLKAAGYSGQKVVVINPTDYPDIGPFGQVTADILRRIGMNVELAETDWGSVIQRRTSRESVDKGGWSIFHTTGGALGWGTPATSDLVHGQGGKGWYGWWDNPQAEEMSQAWLDAPDAESQAKIAVALGRLALDQVATIPLGQFTIRTAYRKTLTGMLPGSAPYPWGLKRV